MNTDKIYAESIAKEYAPKDHSKVVALRKLDSKAKTPATVFAYTFGICSCLVAGLGPENNRRRDGSYEYYISEPVVENDAKGLAPFLMCYTELLQFEEDI